MSALERIKEQIASFTELHSGYDMTITKLELEGTSVFAHTASGIGFEEQIQPGDRIAEALGHTIN
nr:hypothetical protein [Pseudomonas luteola]